jgi:hypothetical protein
MISFTEIPELIQTLQMAVNDMFFSSSKCFKKLNAFQD